MACGSHWQRIGARLDLLVLAHLEVGAGGDFVLFQLPPLGVEDEDFAVAGEHDLLPGVVADDLQAGELDHALFLGADFALFDGVGRRAADVERPHRQLGARLADALGGDDADGHALLDEAARGEVHAVAERADAQRGVAGHGAADLDLLQAQLLDLLRDVQGDQLVFPDDHFVGDRVDDVRPADAAADRVGQADLDLFAAVDDSLGDALRRAAVVRGDDDVLGDVGQLAGQVAGVGRLQGGVGQALAGAVRRAEILQHAQALAEVRLDRRLDDLPRRLGHQTAHPRQLANLLDAAAGAGVGHEEDRVDVAGEAAVVLQLGHHFRGDLFAGVGPGVQHLVVALALGDDAPLVELRDPHHRLFRVEDDLRLVRRGDQVVGGEAQAAERALAEAELVHRVQEVDRRPAAQPLVAVGNHPRQVGRPQRGVVVGHPVGEHRVEHHAADGRVEAFAGVRLRIVLDLPSLGEADLDRRVRGDHALRIGQHHLLERREDHPVALAVGERRGDVVAAHDHVLRRADDRRAVGGAEDVVRGHQQRVRLDLRLDRQRQVDRHLVAVEVGVEALADQRVELDGVAFDEHRLERLDAHAVQRRGPVEHHGMVLDHLFEDVPNLLVLPLEHLLRALDRVGVAQLLQPADDERLVQLQGDFLRQAALVQAQRRPDDDHAPRRVIDALAQQVLAEAALLALDHVRQRLQGAVARSEHGALAAVVVEQRVRPTAATSASRCG